MSSVNDSNNSPSSSSLLVSLGGGCSSDDSGGEMGDDSWQESSLHQRNIYGWQRVQHLLEDNGSHFEPTVLNRRHYVPRSGVGESSSGNFPNIDLMAIPSIIAPPSLGKSSSKRQIFKNSVQFDPSATRQRNYSFKQRKDSESSDDFLESSLSENDLMAIPSMIAPPTTPSPWRGRSDNIPPKPSPKNTSRRARNSSFVSPRDRRKMSAGNYKRKPQINNKIVVSSRSNILLQHPQRRTHSSSMDFTSHEESLKRMPPTQQYYKPNVYSSTSETPQSTTTYDYIDAQSFEYDMNKDAFSVEASDYRSEIYPPLSPNKSLFRHTTEALSGSPPKSILSYWLPPPPSSLLLNENRKYSTSFDEEEEASVGGSTLDGLSTLYSSMVPSSEDSESPLLRPVQKFNSNLEFHPRQYFDDIMNSSPDKKWPNPTDLVNRCPESPLTPHDQFMYGHLHNDYFQERNFTHSNTVEYYKSFSDLQHKSTIQAEITLEVKPDIQPLTYPARQHPQTTNRLGRNKNSNLSPISAVIKKTKLKSSSLPRHHHKTTRKWDFDDFDTVSSDSIDNNNDPFRIMESNIVSGSAIGNSVTPGKRKWKFEELLESNDVENDEGISGISFEGARREDDLNKQGNHISAVMPGKRTWKFEELLASPDDEQSSATNFDVDISDNAAHSDSDDSVHAKDMTIHDNIDDIVTPGKRRWKFEELLKSNDNENDEVICGISVEVARREVLKKQDYYQSAFTPGKRRWKFEELLASSDDEGSSVAKSDVDVNDNAAHSEPDDLNRAKDMIKHDDIAHLMTRGKRRWKSGELLGSNDDEDISGTSLSGTFARHNSIDSSQNKFLNNQNKVGDFTTVGKRRWKFEDLLESNDGEESPNFVGLHDEIVQPDSENISLHNRMDNYYKSTTSPGKRRWKFEELLASNDDESYSSAKLSFASIGTQRQIHLYEETNADHSPTAETYDDELQDIIKVFQSRVRGTIVRQSFQQYQDAASTIQKCVRAHNLRRVQKWEEAVTEVDRINKHFLNRDGMIKLNLEQRQNYLDYYSSIIGMLGSRISDMKQICRYEQYHGFLNTVVHMQANIRAYQSRKPLTTLENEFVELIDGENKTSEAYVLNQIERYAKLHAGFVLLQARCRGVLCRKKQRPDNLVSDQMKRYSQTHAAMVSLQALFRGALCRKRLCDMNLAAIRLQKYVRAMLKRKQFHRVRSGLTAFQARIRGALERKSSFLLKSVVVVQSRLRSFIVRSHYLKTKTCIILLQTKFRGILSIVRVKRFHCSAASIQSIVRGFNERMKYTKVRRGLILFQALVRGQRDRNAVAVTMSALMNMQCRVRSFLQRKRYTQLRMATVLVQSKIRAIKQQTKFRTTIAATLCIQSFVRGSILRNCLSVTSSKAKIQRKWAEYLNTVESMHKSNYDDTLKSFVAATKIQGVYRVQRCQRELLRRKEKARVTLAQKEALAATKVQSVVRTWMCQRSMSRMIEERSIAMVVSRQREAAIVIQSFARSLHCQLDLLSLKKAAIQADHRRRVGAAVVLQSFGRILVCQRLLADMKRESEEHCTVRMVAATTIQSRIRARLCEKELLCRKVQTRERQMAAAKLQTCWRSWACRRDLMVASRTASKIQRCYNRFRLMSSMKSVEHLKASYNKVFLESFVAATKIQGVYRVQRCQRELLRRKEKARVTLAQKEALAATKVQSVVRTWMCQRSMSRMIEERSIAMVVSRQREAAIVIQSFARSLHCQLDLLSLKKAAIQADHRRRVGAAVVLQSFGRILVCQRLLADMKRESEEHCTVRMVAATTIQSRIRARLCEKELLCRKVQTRERQMAAAKLQTCWRSWACRRDLMVASRTASKIQRCYNRFRLMSSMKSVEHLKASYNKVFLESFVAATKIQGVYRVQRCQRELLRRKEKARVTLAQKEALAATKVQSVVRTWMCQRTMSRMIEERSIAMVVSRQREAAIVIQSFARSLHCQLDLLSLKKAAIQADHRRRVGAAVVLQSFGRILVCRRLLADMKRESEEHCTVRMVAATTIQSRIRARLCEKELLCRKVQTRERQMAAAKLQTCWRSWACRRDLMVASRTASKIQRCYNRFRLMSSMKSVEYLKASYNKVFLESFVAATKIQGVYRVQRCQRELLRRKEKARVTLAQKEALAATKVQSVVRTWMCQRSVSRMIEERSIAMVVSRQREAAIVIQSFARSLHCQLDLLSLKKAAIQADHRRRVGAAVVLQSFGRILVCRRLLADMKRESEEHCTVRMVAATTIQSRIRARLCEKELLCRKVQTRERQMAAAKLQTCWRSWACRRDLMVASRTASKIQRCYNRFRLMSSMKSVEYLKASYNKVFLESFVAATKIQGVYRVQRCQRELLRRKEKARVTLAQKEALAATKVQSVVRTWMCQRSMSRMIEERSIAMVVSRQREAAIVIQSFARSLHCQLDLLSLKKAAIQADHRRRFANILTQLSGFQLHFFIRFQAQFRGSLLRKEYRSAVASAVRIQSVWAKKRCISITEIFIYSTYVRSVVTIQNRFRRYYRVLDSSAKKVQLFFLSRRMKRNLKMVHLAVVIIQRVIRGHLTRFFVRRLKRNRYHRAATKIQSFVRSHRCLCDLQIAVTHATKIQRCYHRYKVTFYENACRDEKRAYIDTLKRIHRGAMAVRIQTVARSWLCHQKHLRTKIFNADTKIKMNDEVALVFVSIVPSEGLIEYPTSLNTTDASARVIQEKWRTFRLHKELMMRRKVAAIVIQTFVRSRLCRLELMHLSEAELLAKEAAAVRIQASARSLICQKLRSKLRAEVHNAEMRWEGTRWLAATKIQSIVRSYRCNKDLCSISMNAIKIQRRYRCYKVTVSEKARHCETRAYVKGLERCHREAMAVRIQAIVRFRMCRGKLSNLKKVSDAEMRVEKITVAAAVIQRFVRSWLCRRQLIHLRLRELAKEAASVRIQASTISSHRLSESKSTILIQSIIRMIILKSRFDAANEAANVIQHAWRRYVLSLQKKIIFISELLVVSHCSRKSSLPISMHKARTLLPRDLKRLNRIISITPRLPHRYECGVFIQEVMNSVVVVIQSFVRRYLVSIRKKKLHHAAFSVQKSWRMSSRRRKLLVAILRIQTAARGKLAREKVAILLSSMNIVKRFCCSVTSQYDGRMENETIVADGAEQNATIMLQRFFRVCLAKNSIKKLLLKRDDFESDNDLKRLDQYFESLRFSNKRFEDIAKIQWFVERTRLTREERLENISALKQAESVRVAATLRLSTEEEIGAFLDFIYRQAETNVDTTIPPGTSQCLTTYETKLSHAHAIENRANNAVFKKIE